MWPSTFVATQHGLGPDSCATQCRPDSCATQCRPDCCATQTSADCCASECGTDYRAAQCRASRTDGGGGRGQWRRCTDGYGGPTPGTCPTASRDNQTPPARALGGDPAERFPQ